MRPVMATWWVHKVSPPAFSLKGVPGGWSVTGELQGWQFRINVVEGGLQVSASALGGGDPAVWIVMA